MWFLDGGSREKEDKEKKPLFSADGDEGKYLGGKGYDRINGRMHPRAYHTC